jgi:hypothetical protein
MSLGARGWPETGAHRGCSEEAPAAARLGREEQRAPRPGTRAPFKATCKLPSDQWTGGEALERVRAGRRRRDRRSMACSYGGSAFRGVPGVRGLERRVVTLGRRGPPREHTPEGPGR